MVLEGGTQACNVWAVAFHPDGKHVFGGTNDGIRRWRVADGQEVGKQIGMDSVNAISVSMDQKWVVCGTDNGANVWDAELREKVVEVEGGEPVYAVDIAPDCTRFATGTYSLGETSIWNIATGERLVGPLELGGVVRGVKFSPDGRRIACDDSDDGVIHIFNSHNHGDQLISIKNPLFATNPLTPLVWLKDGERLLATSEDSKIKSFDASTGSQLAEWKIHDNDDPTRMSIALATNNTFIACCAGRFVSFWDISTHTQIGIVEDTQGIRSVAFSLDGSRLVTGSNDFGKLIVWDLKDILPESSFAINVRCSHLEYTFFFRPCNFLVRPDPRT